MQAGKRACDVLGPLSLPASAGAGWLERACRSGGESAANSRKKLPKKSTNKTAQEIGMRAARKIYTVL